MRRAAYRQIEQLESQHFWFKARREIFIALLDQLVSPGKGRILEIGSGAGGFLKPLSRYGDVLGFELSAYYAAKSSKATQTTVVCGDGQKLPFRESSFELVCLFDSLEHIEDDEEVLSEVCRVLKPGGVVFVSVPAYQFLFANNDRVAHHKRRYTRDDLSVKMLSAGIKITKSSYFNSLLFPLILPMVLVLKSFEKMGLIHDTEHTNLDLRLPAWVEYLFFKVMTAEKHLLKLSSFCFGHSIIISGQKPAV